MPVASSRKKEEKTDINKTAEPLQEYVFVVENQTAKIKAVKTGIQDNSNIQILEGLSENDEVVTGPYRVVSKTLKNDDKVKVVDKTKLFEATKKYQWQIFY